MDAPYYLASMASRTREAPEPSVGLRDILSFLRTSSRSIAMGAAVCAAAALLYVVLAPPKFTATAEVLTDIVDVAGLFQDDARPEPATDQARVESQIEVVKSNPVALAVVRSLHLTEDPAFVPTTPSLTQLLLSWVNSLWPGAGGQEPVSKEAIAVATLQDRLSVRRIGQSLVIEVDYDAGDPASAARITNAITQAYLDQDVEARSEATRRTAKWLQDRLAGLQQQALEAQRATEEFRLLGDRSGLDQSDARAKLAQLETASQGYQQVYEAFLHKLAETMQRVSYPEGGARVISPATPPLHKSWPKAVLILAFATIFGAGCGTAFAAARTNGGSLSPGKLAEIGVECLGTVSRLRTPGSGRRRGLRSLLPRRKGDHGRGGSFIPRITAAGASPRFVRELRSLRTSVTAATLSSKSRCLGVVASHRGEGATTLATNLALLAAMSGARTLLVDACADNPTISREFAGAAEVGLMQAFDQPETCTRLLAEQASRQIAILPLGKADAAVTPGDRISSGRAAFRIGDLKETFDLVVFDLPALTSSSDARAIAPHLDGVVLVAESGRASTEAIAEAAASLQGARANLIGVVINKVPAKVKGDEGE